IYNNVIILMVVFSSLSLYLFYIICVKFSINPVYAWLIYFPYSFLLKDLAQIRNAVASLLVVYALLALTKVRSLIIFCFASIFFQKYAIASSIALYKPKLVYKDYFWVVIIGMFFIPSLSVAQLQGIPFIGFDLSRYINSDYVLGNSVAQKIKMLALSLFLSAFFIRTISGDVRLKALYFAYIGSYFYYCLFFNIPIISQRLGGYLSAVEPFLFSVLIESVSRRNSIVVYGVVVLLSVFYFTFNLYSRDFLQGLFFYGQ
ncbi:EpsG family protein, partial [Citrobacter portucalensis]|uniref:EpsG family protein n=1 Tax=Citrobacter portucalensis TaxID=1639133 RepID=UPI00226B8CF5